jgi:hypothetical protein
MVRSRLTQTEFQSRGSTLDQQVPIGADCAQELGADDVAAVELSDDLDRSLARLTHHLENIDTPRLAALVI